MLKTLLAVVFILSCTDSYAERYTIDRDHSSVAFSIRHTVSRVTGKFTNFSGSIVYDQFNLDQSSVSVRISVESIDTENLRRDSHLRSADFFDVKSYPHITFKSTKVTDAGVGKLDVAGELSMHGVTHSVTIPIEITGIGLHPGRRTPLAGFSSSFILKRSDYGVDSWADAAGVLGDEVTVTLDIRADASASDSRAAANPRRRGRTLTATQLKEIQKRMFARFPALKKEFEAAVKEDPEIETNQEKWMLFMQEMREKGVLRGGRRGRR